MLVAMSRTKLSSFSSGNAGVRKTINVDLTSASGHGRGRLPDTKSVCVCGEGGGRPGCSLGSYTYALQQILPIPGQYQTKSGSRDCTHMSKP